MPKTQIPYGSKPIKIETAGEVLDLEGESDRSKITPEPEDQTAIKHALQNPLGTKRLREIVAQKEAAKIVIVIDDHTRDAPTEKMLDALTEEIREGGKGGRVTLLVACGTHSAPAEEDLKRILGKHFSRFGENGVKVHDCDAGGEELVQVGTTSRGTPVRLNRTYLEADLKILTGDLTLHYYAGFGGGRKSILPGIAARETINANHALLTDERDRARTANLEDNPVHLDMTEAASFAPPDFVLNAVADASGNLVGAYAGEMNAVFLKGAEVAKKLFCFELVPNELFDVLVVSAGGFPKDRNLYQATKAVENCYRAVAPGGRLILVAECREGVGDAYFEEWMNEHGTYEAAAAAVRTNFVLGGHKAFYIRKAMKRVRLSVVSELDAALLNAWGISAYDSAQVAVREAEENAVREAEEKNIKDKTKVKVGIIKNGLDTLLVPSERK